MNSRSDSRNNVTEEKRDERGRLMPMNIHELMGNPKSGGKTKKEDGAAAKPTRMQPVLIKDLLMSMSSQKKSQPAGRRMTAALGAMTNARRQLYGEASGRSFPVKTSLTSSDRRANDGRDSRPARLIGVSRSEGKNMKISGQEPNRPGRNKECMASWEKSQTVKQEARKSVIGDLGSRNVRRKLYNNAPSPAATTKVARKSVALNKFQPHRASISNRRSIKPEPQKSGQPQSRKSCLLPPNSIRDKHINRQQNETIKEESPVFPPDDRDPEDTGKSQKPPAESPRKDSKISHKNAVSPEESLEIRETKITVANSSSTSTRKSLETKNLKNETSRVPRPTVIITAPLTIEKNPRKSRSSSGPESCDSKKSPFALYRQPLQELRRNSMFPARRLDAMDSSLDELTGNSRLGDSFAAVNLPYNSFLEAPRDTKIPHPNVDKQTLSWMHGNLKQTIQCAEENLFTMKQMLRTLEDLQNSWHDEAENSSIGARSIDVAAGSKSPSRKIQREKSAEFPTGSSTIASETSQPEARFAEESKFDEDKENFCKNHDDIMKNSSGGRRRSARLAALQNIGASPRNAEDSFSMIERELNIFHDKSRSQTLRVETPLERRKIDPRSRRSMREYMALKSMVNCLQTPDVKGMPTPKGEIDTPSHRLANKRSLSRQLLTELDDLYAESPQ